jgi:transcription antitermination factor NusG
LSLLNLNYSSHMPCFAVKVRTRSEEYTANLLRQKDFEVLAPTYMEMRKYSDRTCKVSSALFPGYIFVRMDPRELLQLVSTDGVSYVVRTGAGLQPLPNHETHAIEAFCKGMESCQPCTYFREGQRVRIESGPFIGVEGLLVQVRDAKRLVISVDTLCSSVSLEVGAHRLRLLDEPASTMVGGQETSQALAN